MEMKRTVWVTSGQPLMEMKRTVWVTSGQPLMEMVTPQSYPFIKTITAEIKADVAILLSLAITIWLCLLSLIYTVYTRLQLSSTCLAVT